MGKYVWNSVYAIDIPNMKLLKKTGCAVDLIAWEVAFEGNSNIFGFNGEPVWVLSFLIPGEKLQKGCGTHSCISYCTLTFPLHTVHL